MALFDINVTLGLPAAFFNAVDRLVTAVTTTGAKIMADLTVLSAKVDTLTSKVDEASTTLTGLKDEVIKLKESLPPDQQPEVDAIVAKIDAAVEKLAAAEDDADDQLPVTP